MNMLRKCLHTKKRSIAFFTLLATLVLYAEVLVYLLVQTKWSNITCDNQKECTKILLVADPQLIGLYNDGVVSYFTRLDSDRYLRKTYIQAYSYTKPDIVIYLGDLTDEGSRAKQDEFNDYVRRFFSIFPVDNKSKVKHIWLPGDNDIGGEGADIVTSRKTNRFSNAFKQDDIIYANNITFYKINRLTHEFPTVANRNRIDFSSSDTQHLVVGLSHVPLLFRPALFVDKVLTSIQPHLLFTAHEHKSMVVLTDSVVRQDRRIIPIRSDDAPADRVRSFPLASGDICEVLVPTCNYRMGTLQIGYGFAVVENNELKYTVLWSPSRFHYLGVYLIVIVVLLPYFLCYLCFKCGQKSGSRLKYSPLP